MHVVACGEALEEDEHQLEDQNTLVVLLQLEAGANQGSDMRPVPAPVGHLGRSAFLPIN